MIMEKINFKVSARTAKLIGRENFSNPEGAIIELVKNSYDADAKQTFVIFNIVYESTPKSIPKSTYMKIGIENKEIQALYSKKGDEFILKNDLTEELKTLVKEYFLSKNNIYIIDNGDGMSKKIIKSHWMQIGTNNKETDFETDEGRIKTGAKGIGRFALDRLGYKSEMWTVPKTDDSSVYWKMNWRQFDNPEVSISEINADIEERQINIKNSLLRRFVDNHKIISTVNQTNFNNGTVIKISELKDEWYENKLDSIYNSLQALIPPKELKIPFSVYFFNLQRPKNYGEVETAFFDDFDYKIISKYRSENQKISLEITRNEIDLKKVDRDFKNVLVNSEPPYDLKTIKEKTFKEELSAYEVLKWEQSTSNTQTLKDLGDFEFSFYFLKMTVSQKENYPYKEIVSAERKKIIDEFGGVKIYRDSFRVRPYGDSGNDWLHLGERVSQSPAGPGQRIGDWRIRPNQIAGIINISRLTNTMLVDKSDRGSLVENDAFKMLIRLVIGMIHHFELDRSRILNPFYEENLKQKELDRKEEIRIEAEKLADIIIERRKREDEARWNQKVEQIEQKRKEEERYEREEYQKLIEESLDKFQSDEDKDAEIAQVRNLASLGLITSSFAHELKEVRNNVDEIIDLKEIFDSIDCEEFINSRGHTNANDILELLERDGKRIKHWVNYSLSAIKKDKRKRKAFRFEEYFNVLVKDWDYALKERNVELELKNNITGDYNFRAFEMDMNTIFGNLISNSVDAFKNVKEIIDRKIKIEYSLNNNAIEILYSDNGTGIPKVFKDINDIFLPFTTSKKDREGNNIGTGLGMYLVKNVVDDNNGNIEFLESNQGVNIKITFTTRKR